MKKIYLILLLVFPILLQNCSSGKKAYEQGNYYQAVLQSVNRLRQNPDHKKSKNILRESYSHAVQLKQSNADILLNSNDPFKNTKAVRIFQDLNHMHDEIRRSPGALTVISNPKSFHNKIEELKMLAAQENYNEGVRLLNRNTREEAREAYYMFLNVREFSPNLNNDLDNLIADAKFKATLKVLVEQIPVPGMYNLSGGYFQDKVEEYLNTHFRSSPFVRFYNEKEMKLENVPYVDQYLRIQFDDFVVGQTHRMTNSETFTRDSVVVGTVKMEDGSLKNVYNSVSAKLTTNRKEILSKGLLSMQVYDAHSDALLRHNKFSAEFMWFCEWGNFNGDERALSDEQLAICGSSEMPPPPPQDLFIAFTGPIYDQLIPDINAYYSNF